MKRRPTGVTPGKPARIRPLSPMAKRAIDIWFTNGFNKAAAMREAGYGQDGKGTIAPVTIFNTPPAKAYIGKKQRELREKSALTPEWVIQRLMRIANGPEVLARYTRILEDGTIIRDFAGASLEDLAVITKVVNEEYTEGRGANTREVKKFSVETASPQAALDSLMRHLGLFNDKVDVAIETDLVSRLQRGRERVLARGNPDSVEQKPTVELRANSEGTFVPSDD